MKKTHTALSQILSSSHRKKLYLAISAQFMLAAGAYAAPQGGQVVGGNGTIDQSDNLTTIVQETENLAIDWDSFDVDEDEIVRFVQPSDDSLALNRILGNDASEIFGSLEANGHVILVNPNGVFFGENATVNVGSLVASGLAVDKDKFLNGEFTLDALEGTDGAVINHGIINAATGGSVVLVGQSVKNTGLISAKLGNVALAAGKQAVLTFDSRGLLGVRVSEEVLQDELGVDPAVQNSGDINAEGGNVLLTASVSQDVFSKAVNAGGMTGETSVVMHDDGSFTLGGGADVVNTGSINVSSQVDAGNAVILGQNIVQSGEVLAESSEGEAGAVEIHAQETVLLNADASVSASGAQGGDVKVLGDQIALTDTSKITANGEIHAGEIKVGGDIQGVNEAIPTAQTVYLGEQTSLSADTSLSGDGGEVIVFAEGSTQVLGGISARGGALSGDGGFVETSGKKGFDIHSVPDVTAANGFTGEWLIDPSNIEIIAGADFSGITESVNVFESVADSAQIGVDIIVDALNSGATVTIATGDGGSESGDITFNADLIYEGTADATLNLNAHNNILLNSNINASTVVRENGSLSLNLNANLAGDQGSITAGDVRIDTHGGNIYVSAYDIDFSAAQIDIVNLDAENIVSEFQVEALNDVVLGEMDFVRDEDGSPFSGIHLSYGEIDIFSAGNIEFRDEIYTNGGGVRVEGENIYFIGEENNGFNVIANRANTSDRQDSFSVNLMADNEVLVSNVAFVADNISIRTLIGDFSVLGMGVIIGETTVEVISGKSIFSEDLSLASGETLKFEAAENIVIEGNRYTDTESYLELHGDDASLILQAGSAIDIRSHIQLENGDVVIIAGVNPNSDAYQEVDGFESGPGVRGKTIGTLGDVFIRGANFVSIEDVGFDHVDVEPVQQILNRPSSVTIESGGDIDITGSAFNTFGDVKISAGSNDISNILSLDLLDGSTIDIPALTVNTNATVGAGNFTTGQVFINTHGGSLDVSGFDVDLRESTIQVVDINADIGSADLKVTSANDLYIGEINLSVDDAQEVASVHSSDGTIELRSGGDAYIESPMRLDGADLNVFSDGSINTVDDYSVLIISSSGESIDNVGEISLNATENIFVGVILTGQSINLNAVEGEVRVAGALGYVDSTKISSGKSVVFESGSSLASGYPGSLLEVSAEENIIFNPERLVDSNIIGFYQSTDDVNSRSFLLKAGSAIDIRSQINLDQGDFIAIAGTNPNSTAYQELEGFEGGPGIRAKTIGSDGDIYLRGANFVSIEGIADDNFNLEPDFIDNRPASVTIESGGDIEISGDAFNAAGNIRIAAGEQAISNAIDLDLQNGSVLNIPALSLSANVSQPIGNVTSSVATINSNGGSVAISGFNVDLSTSEIQLVDVANGFFNSSLLIDAEGELRISNVSFESSANLDPSQSENFGPDITLKSGADLIINGSVTSAGGDIAIESGGEMNLDGAFILTAFDAGVETGGKLDIVAEGAVRIGERVTTLRSDNELNIVSNSENIYIGNNATLLSRETVNLNAPGSIYVGGDLPAGIGFVEGRGILNVVAGENIVFNAYRGDANAVPPVFGFLTPQDIETDVRSVYLSAGSGIDILSHINLASGDFVAIAGTDSNSLAYQELAGFEAGPGIRAKTIGSDGDIYLRGANFVTVEGIGDDNFNLVPDSIFNRPASVTIESGGDIEITGSVFNTAGDVVINAGAAAISEGTDFELVDGSVVNIPQLALNSSADAGLGNISTGGVFINTRGGSLAIDGYDVDLAQSIVQAANVSLPNGTTTVNISAENDLTLGVIDFSLADDGNQVASSASGVVGITVGGDFTFGGDIYTNGAGLNIQVGGAVYDDLVTGTYNVVSTASDSNTLSDSPISIVAEGGIYANQLNVLGSEVILQSNQDVLYLAGGEGGIYAEGINLISASSITIDAGTRITNLNDQGILRLQSGENIAFEQSTAPFSGSFAELYGFQEGSFQGAIFEAGAGIAFRSDIYFPTADIVAVSGLDSTSTAHEDFRDFVSGPGITAKSIFTNGNIHLRSSSYINLENVGSDSLTINDQSTSARATSVTLESGNYIEVSGQSFLTAGNVSILVGPDAIAASKSLSLSDGTSIELASMTSHQANDSDRNGHVLFSNPGDSQALMSTHGGAISIQGFDTASSTGEIQFLNDWLLDTSLVSSLGDVPSGGEGFVELVSDLDVLLPSIKTQTSGAEAKLEVTSTQGSIISDNVLQIDGEIRLQAGENIVLSAGSVLDPLDWSKNIYLTAGDVIDFNARTSNYIDETTSNTFSLNPNSETSLVMEAGSAVGNSQQRLMLALGLGDLVVNAGFDSEKKGFERFDTFDLSDSSPGIYLRTSLLASYGRIFLRGGSLVEYGAIGSPSVSSSLSGEADELYRSPSSFSVYSGSEIVTSFYGASVEGNIELDASAEPLGSETILVANGEEIQLNSLVIPTNVLGIINQLTTNESIGSSHIQSHGGDIVYRANTINIAPHVTFDPSSKNGHGDVSFISEDTLLAPRVSYSQSISGDVISSPTLSLESLTGDVVWMSALDYNNSSNLTLNIVAAENVYLGVMEGDAYYPSATTTNPEGGINWFVGDLAGDIADSDSASTDTLNLGVYAQGDLVHKFNLDNTGGEYQIDADQIHIKNAGFINFGDVVANDMLLQVSGAVDQTGILTIANDFSLIAEINNFSVFLDNPENQFNTVSIDAQFPIGGSVAIEDRDSLILADVNTSGTLTVNARNPSGAIIQGGEWNFDSDSSGFAVNIMADSIELGGAGTYPIYMGAHALNITGADELLVDGSITGSSVQPATLNVFADSEVDAILTVGENAIFENINPESFFSLGGGNNTVYLSADVPFAIQLWAGDDTVYQGGESISASILGGDGSDTFYRREDVAGEWHIDEAGQVQLFNGQDNFNSENAALLTGFESLVGASEHQDSFIYSTPDFASVDLLLDGGTSTENVVRNVVEFRLDSEDLDVAFPYAPWSNIQDVSAVYATAGNARFTLLGGTSGEDTNIWSTQADSLVELAFERGGAEQTLSLRGFNHFAGEDADDVFNIQHSLDSLIDLSSSGYSFDGGSGENSINYESSENTNWNIRADEIELTGSGWATPITFKGIRNIQSGDTVDTVAIYGSSTIGNIVLNGGDDLLVAEGVGITIGAIYMGEGSDTVDLLQSVTISGLLDGGSDGDDPALGVTDVLNAPFANAAEYDFLTDTSSGIEDLDNSNFESVLGGTASRFFGGDGDTEFTLNSDGTFTVSNGEKTAEFSTAAFDVLISGIGENLFTFTEGAVYAGAIEGNEDGNNTLIANDLTNKWVIEGRNSGRMQNEDGTILTEFTNMQHLVGVSDQEYLEIVQGGILESFTSGGGVLDINFGDAAYLLNLTANSGVLNLTGVNAVYIPRLDISGVTSLAAQAEDIYWFGGVNYDGSSIDIQLTANGDVTLGAESNSEDFRFATNVLQLTSSEVLFSVIEDEVGRDGDQLNLDIFAGGTLYSRTYIYSAGGDVSLEGQSLDLDLYQELINTRFSNGDTGANGGQGRISLVSGSDFVIPGIVTQNSCTLSEDCGTVLLRSQGGLPIDVHNDADTQSPNSFKVAGDLFVDIGEGDFYVDFKDDSDTAWVAGAINIQSVNNFEFHSLRPFTLEESVVSGDLNLFNYGSPFAAPTIQGDAPVSVAGNLVIQAVQTVDGIEVEGGVVEFSNLVVSGQSTVRGGEVNITSAEDLSFTLLETNISESNSTSVSNIASLRDITIVDAEEGDLSQREAVLSGGIVNFTAGESVHLASQVNQFSSFGISAGNAIQLEYLGNVEILGLESNSLMISAIGQVAQSGDISVTGLTEIRTTGDEFSINFDRETNHFGSVSIDAQFDSVGSVSIVGAEGFSVESISGNGSLFLGAANSGASLVQQGDWLLQDANTSLSLDAETVNLGGAGTHTIELNGSTLNVNDWQSLVIDGLVQGTNESNLGIVQLTSDSEQDSSLVIGENARLSNLAESSSINFGLGDDQVEILANLPISVYGNAGDDTFSVLREGIILGSVYGEAGSDTILMRDDVSVVGVVDGGSDLASSEAEGTIDHLDLSQVTASYEYNFETKQTDLGFDTRGFENTSASDAGFSIFGGNVDTTWLFNLDGSLTVSSGSDSETFDLVLGIRSGAGFNEFVLQEGAAPAITVSADEEGDNALVSNSLLTQWALTGSDSGRVQNQDGSAFVDFTNIGTLVGGAGHDQFVLQDGSDIRSIDTGLGDDGVIIQGNATFGVVVGGDGFDTLTAADISNNWDISNGRLNDLAFDGFERLVGGSGDDRFSIGDNSAEVISIIVGNDGRDTLISSSETNNWNLQENTLNEVLNFEGIEVLDGSLSADDTLIAPNQDNDWLISGDLSGVLNSQIEFTQIEKLQGGDSADTFMIADNAQVIEINAGLGDDIVTVGANASVTKLCTCEGDDRVTVGPDSILENVNLGTGDDVLDIRAGARITGTFDAGSDLEINGDVLNIESSGYENVTRQNAEAILGFSIVSFEELLGIEDLLLSNETNYWFITGKDSGYLRTFVEGEVQDQSFSQLPSLNGGDGDDIFIFATDDASVSEGIYGGGGSNTLALTWDDGENTLVQNLINSWIIDGQNSGRLENNSNPVGNIFEGIASIIGGGSQDLFTVEGSGQLASITGASGIDGITANTDVNNQWHLGENENLLNGTVAFAQVEHLIGNNLDDTFTLVSNRQDVTQLYGGLGTDTVELSFSDDALVELQSSSIAGVVFSEIELLIGQSTHAIQGASVDTQWLLDRAQAGSISFLEEISGNPVNVDFSGFGALLGGDASDQFIVQSRESLPTNIYGGEGDDLLDVQLVDSSINLAVGENQLENGSVGLVAIERVIANSDQAVVVYGASDKPYSWSMTGEHSAELTAADDLENTLISFDGISAIQGGDSIDLFIVGDSGNQIAMDGGVGAAVDIVDYSQVNSNLQIHLAEALTVSSAQISGVEGVKGNNSGVGSIYDAELIGGDTATQWLVSYIDDGISDGVNDGQVEFSGQTVRFMDFNILRGGQGSDDFTVLSDAVLEGQILGSGGNDSLEVQVGSTNRLISFDGGLGLDSLSFVGSDQDASVSFSEIENGGRLRFEQDAGTYTSEFFNVENINDGTVAQNLLVIGGSGSDVIGLLQNGIALNELAMLSYENKRHIAIQAQSNDVVQLREHVDIPESLTLTNGRLEASNGANASISAADLILSSVSDVGSVDLPIRTDIDRLTVNNGLGDILLQDQTGLEILGFISTGETNITALNGDIRSQGDIISSDDFNLVAQTGNIALRGANQISGNVRFVASEDIAWENNSTMLIAEMTAKNVELVTSRGIVAEGIVQVEDDIFLTAQNDIMMENPLNDFNRVSIPDARNVSLVDQNSMELVLANVRGYLWLDALGITVSGDAVADAMRFNANAGIAEILGDLDTSKGRGVEILANLILQNGDIVSGGNTELVSSTSIAQNGSIQSVGNVSAVAQAGDVIASDSVKVSGADVILEASGNLLVQDIDADSVKLSGGQLVVTGGSLFASDGDITVESGSYTLSVNSVLKAEEGAIRISASDNVDTAADLTGSSVTITGDNVNLGGNVTAMDGNVDVTGVGGVTVGQNISGNTGVSVSASEGTVSQVGNIGTNTGNVNLSSGGDSDVVMGSGATIAVGTGNVSISAGKDVIIANVTSSGEVNIETGSGSIVDGNGESENISADKMVVKSGGGVGDGDALETNVDAIDVTANVGGVDIENRGDVTVSKLETQDGDVNLANTGNVKLDTNSVVAKNGNGNATVNISLENGDLTQSGPSSLPAITSEKIIIDTPNGVVGDKNKINLAAQNILLLVSDFQNAANIVTPSTTKPNIIFTEGYKFNDAVLSVEPLEDVSPSVFNNVKSYFHNDISLKLPADQRYDDEDLAEEEEAE